MSLWGSAGRCKKRGRNRCQQVATGISTTEKLKLLKHGRSRQIARQFEPRSKRLLTISQLAYTRAETLLWYPVTGGGSLTLSCMLGESRIENEVVLKTRSGVIQQRGIVGSELQMRRSRRLTFRTVRFAQASYGEIECVVTIQYGVGLEKRPTRIDGVVDG